MKIQDKVVVIISHEDWGEMLMSKHHYAITLAENRNKVFFINHPDRRHSIKRGTIRITPTSFHNLSVIQHRLPYPYFFKSRYSWLYNVLISIHIKRILRKMNISADIVWSFDTSNTLPLKYFRASVAKIFMPVDGPFWHKDELKSSETADVIVSVTNQILSRYTTTGKPQMLIGHGVANAFMSCATNVSAPGQGIRIGYSGSLLRDDLGSEVLLAIIRKHADKTFELWGEYDASASNIHLPQNIPVRVLDFIDNLKKLPNVILHGSVTPEALAKGLNGMDALLICYNHDCMNSHKLLEYLALGKVVISTPVSSYMNTGLIEMSPSVEPDAYMATFEKVVADLQYHNLAVNREKRRAYARAHSYKSNVEKIGDFIEQAAHEQA